MACIGDISFLFSSCGEGGRDQASKLACEQAREWGKEREVSEGVREGDTLRNAFLNTCM